MDIFRKVSAGDRFVPSARTWNAIVDAAKHFKRGDGAIVGESYSTTPETSVEILVRNDFAETVDQFEILKITGVLINRDADAATFNSRRAVTGDEPTGYTNEPYCVAMEPIASGSIGRATLLGVTPVKVDLLDTDHRYAQPSSVESLASTGYGSARIIWIEDNFGSTGVKWAFVLLRGEERIATPNNRGIISRKDEGDDYDGTDLNRHNPEYQWLGNGSKGVDSLMVGGYVRFNVTSGHGTYGTPADSYYTGQFGGLNPFISGSSGSLLCQVSTRAYFSLEADADNGTATLYTSGLSSEINVKAKEVNFASQPEGLSGGYAAVDINGSLDVRSNSEPAFHADTSLTYMQTVIGSIGSFRYGLGTGRYFYGPGGLDFVDGNFIRGSVRIGGGIYIADSLTGSMSLGQTLEISGVTYFKNGIFIGGSLPPASGTLGVANGGTGATSFTSGEILYGNGTGAILSATNATIVGGVLTVTDGANTISMGVEEL